MRNHVSFRAGFPKDRLEGPPGRESAMFIGAALQARGIACDEPQSIDYAYDMRCRPAGGAVRLAAGLVEDGDREWLVVVEQERTLLQRLLRRGDRGAVLGTVCSTLDAVLHSADRVTAVQWFTAAEWNDPGLDRGHEHPLG